MALISQRRRKKIHKRDEGRCVYCNKPSRTLTLDHIVPRSLGGTKKKSNLVSACYRCNQKKRDKTLEEFAQAIGQDIAMLRARIRFYIRRIPQKPKVRSVFHSFIGGGYVHTVDTLW